MLKEKMKILINNDPVMKHALETYKKFTADGELLQVYEAREKRFHDEATRLSDARQEGSLKKDKEAASVLKKANVSLDIICRSTGLTVEKIDKL